MSARLCSLTACCRSDRRAAMRSSLLSDLTLDTNSKQCSILESFETSGPWPRENAMLMDAAAYRDSLRAYKPRVFVDGQRVESVADEPLLLPASTASGSPTTSPPSRPTSRS